MRLLACCIVLMLPALAIADEPDDPAYIAWWSSSVPRADRGAYIAPPAAVVRIIVPNGDSIAYGSGTLVDAQDKYGLIVTNWHVVDGAVGEITVVFPDGFRSGAKVLKTDKDWDLAALAIWRPKCAPIPLSTTPPQPGEPLTINGYGSGQFRQAAGQCIQYGAPSVHHPAEIIEISTTARQGDSGGPIFNQRGELAGVLFGTGGGVTSGSYCGRVRTFLSSVMPPADGGTARIAARPVAMTNPSASAPARAPANAGSPNDWPLEPTRAVPATMTPIQPASEQAPSAMSQSPAPRPNLPSSAPAYSTFESTPPSAPTYSVDNKGDAPWEQWAGKTTFEQGKTILAAVGVLAVLSRVLSRDKVSDEETSDDDDDDDDEDDDDD